MHIIRKINDTIIKTINWHNVCTSCQKSEQDLVGTSIKTIKNINIFSVEGMCIDCEIMNYPERFHGCGFCRRPIREKFSCTICTDGFVEWVKAYVYPMDNFSELIKRSAPDLIDYTIYNLPQIQNTKFILRVDDGYYKWPGFYAGITNRFSKGTYTNIESICVDDHEHTNTNTNTNTNVDRILDSFIDKPSDMIHTIDNFFIPIWIVPRLLKQPCFGIADLKLELNIFKKWLLDILEANDIYLYLDVQIDGSTVNFEQIVKVNPYDTRVIN